MEAQGEGLENQIRKIGKNDCNAGNRHDRQGHTPEPGGDGTEHTMSRLALQPCPRDQGDFAPGKLLLQFVPCPSFSESLASVRLLLLTSKA